MEDVDFSTKVTREELESMCADLFDRVGKPVTDALKSADITMVTDLCSTRIMSISNFDGMNVCITFVLRVFCLCVCICVYVHNYVDY